MQTSKRGPEQAEAFSPADYISKTGSLYSLVESLDLPKYYAGTSFEGNRKLQIFMSWLKKNNAALTGSLLHELKSRGISGPINNSAEAAGAIFVWLGGRYIAHFYPSSNEQVQRFPEIVIEDAGYGVVSIANKNEFKIHIPKSDLREICSYYGERDITSAALLGFNVGVHEHTHLLQKINGNEEILSEMAAYFATSERALPVKIIGIKPVPMIILNGAGRDFPHTWGQITKGNLQLKDEFDEYLPFALGPWIKKYYGKTKGYDNIFDFELSAEEQIRRMGRRKTVHLNDFYTLLRKETGLFGWFFRFNEYDGNKMCKSIGVYDPDLAAKFDEVLVALRGRMKDGALDDESHFINALVDVMNQVFGKPIDDLPQGFVYVFPSSPSRIGSKNYFFRDKTDTS